MSGIQFFVCRPHQKLQVKHASVPVMELFLVAGVQFHPLTEEYLAVQQPRDGLVAHPFLLVVSQIFEDPLPSSQPYPKYIRSYGV